MFGFPALFSVLPITPLTFEKIIEEHFGNEKVDLDDATQIDFHTYSVNGVSYKQKVYRLKDNSIYVETTQHSESLEELKEQLAKAVSEQRFEDAVWLRDRIKLRK